MVGLPGSGKSTMAKKLAEEYGAEIISTDAIRKEVLGVEGDLSEDSRIFKIAHDRCAKLLKSGQSVIFDACNLSIGARKGVLQCAKGMNGVRRMAYVMAADVWKCIENDSPRERKCGSGVILSCAEDYTPPRMMEGFTEIIRQRIQEIFK